MSPVVDPMGKGQHEPGAKLDSGKPLAGLMIHDFAKALLAVAEVTTYGAMKYSESGWKCVPKGIKRYRDARMRHILMGDIEELDAESGLMHDAHVAWNALAILQMKLERKNGSERSATEPESIKVEQDRPAEVCDRTMPASA